MRRMWMVLVLLAALQVAAQTTIRDTLYDASGRLAEGRCNIQWQAFQSAQGASVAGGQLTVAVRSGILQVALVPTIGGSPSGASYQVRCSLAGSPPSEWEQWVVPDSVTTLRLADVRVNPSLPGLVNRARLQDVDGLEAALAARPVRAADYASQRAAIIDGTGALASAPGDPDGCVRADGSTGPCGTPTGPGFTTGRAARIDDQGRLESVAGASADCVRVDGTSGACGDAVLDPEASPNQAARIDAMGRITSVPGAYADCVRANGSAGPCGLLGAIEYRIGDTLFSGLTVEFRPSPTIGYIHVEQPTRNVVEMNVNTALILSQEDAQSGKPWRCETTGPAAAMVCQPLPIVDAMTRGHIVHLIPATAAPAGPITLRVWDQGPYPVRRADGVTDPGADAWTVGQWMPLWFDGSVWRMSSAAGGATSLDALTDVTITAPVDGQVLTRQSGAWVNAPAAGGGIGGALGSADNVVPRAAGEGGATLQPSALTLTDSGHWALNGVTQCRIVYSGADHAGVTTNSTYFAPSYTFAPGDLAVGDQVNFAWYLETVDGADTLISSVGANLYVGATALIFNSNSSSRTAWHEVRTVVGTATTRYVLFRTFDSSGFTNFGGAALDLTAGGQVRVLFNKSSGDDTGYLRTLRIQVCK